MPKSENQKLKLLYIAKILRAETDEAHPISTPELIDKLAQLDIKVERKTIYSDIEYLRDFGMDIELIKNKTNSGYYLVSDEFELAEIKLLVDMVQASRFITKKKSRDLIKKLETLTNIHSAKELSRDVYVIGRAKAENESVFYNIDDIHNAINNGKTISFVYTKYMVNKELALKNSGSIYTVSPYYLTWNNENYYLIAVDHKNGEIRHYRVDRMKQININDESRQYSNLFEGFDIAEYTKSSFNMFGGESIRTTIAFPNHLIDVAIDRFGKDVPVRVRDDESFLITADIVPSGQFYGWITGLGPGVSIVAPVDIKEKYHEYLGNLYLLS